MTIPVAESLKAQCPECSFEVVYIALLNKWLGKIKMHTRSCLLYTVICTPMSVVRKIWNLLYTRSFNIEYFNSILLYLFNRLSFTVHWIVELLINISLEKNFTLITILGTKKIRWNINIKCFSELRQLLFTSHVDLKECTCVQRIVVPLVTTITITGKSVMLKTKKKLSLTIFNDRYIAFVGKTLVLISKSNLR